MNAENGGNNPVHDHHVRFRLLVSDWQDHKADEATFGAMRDVFHELEDFEQREPLKRLWWLMEALADGLQTGGVDSGRDLASVFERVDRQLEGIENPASTHQDMRVVHSDLIRDILSLIKPAVDSSSQCRKVFEFYNPGYWHR